MFKYFYFCFKAETQFRPVAEFSDDALRYSKIPASNVDVVVTRPSMSDITDITNATANLSVDSPAMNTRRKSFMKIFADSPTVDRSINEYAIPPPPPNKARKRRSVCSTSTIW